ncbi:MAG TPA: hypothetical protein VIY49_36620 [Bryobacteraceae bacterium]
MTARFRAGICALIPAALLVAGDPLWKTKPPAQWTEDDAKQVLAASPWSMEIVAGVAARETEDQRREGGNMGQPRGVGYDNVDPKGSGPKLPPNIFTPSNQRSPRSLPGTMRLRLRWESALPVQLAELKAHEIDPPTLEGEGYRIAVYGLPSGDFKGDPKKLGDPLKSEAFLRREGKPDVKPLRVEVFQRDDGAAVVYLFPFSAEITEKNGQVEFNAHIGRIVVDQIFTLAQMEFQGKLEL